MYVLPSYIPRCAYSSIPAERLQYWQMTAAKALAEVWLAMELRVWTAPCTVGVTDSGPVPGDASGEPVK